MKLQLSKIYIVLVFSQLFICPTFGIKAEFIVTSKSNCAPAVFSFINKSTAGAGIIYTWDFGLRAKVIATDNAPLEQLYYNAGIYKITLIVTDGTNTDSTSTTITILKSPQASYTPGSIAGCPPLTVNFKSSSTSGDAAIVQTFWDFRNGVTGEGTEIQNTYTTPGSYGVLFKVVDSNGCFSMIESENIIRVDNKPVVNFEATDIYACLPPLNTTFNNLSQGASNLSYHWNFGNGKTSDELSNSVVYNAKGNYNVTLKATDQNGCTDSITKVSYIKIGNDQGTFSVFDEFNNPVDKDFLCNGTYSFVFSINNLPDYTWKIQDNKKITIIEGKPVVSYLVKDTGSLTVSVIYGKNGDCTQNFQKKFRKSSVKASFSMDTSLFCTLPQTILLQNTSKNDGNSFWYLSDKFISNLPDATYEITKNDVPSQTYQQLYSHEIQSNAFTFKLLVSNKDGCTDFLEQKSVMSVPTARIMPNKTSGCVPLSVSFSDSSKSDYSTEEYQYIIGTSKVILKNGLPVNYTFTTPGEYEVKQVIRSEGCIDTSMAIKILAGDILTTDFTVSPAEICNGSQVRMAVSSGDKTKINSWHVISDGLFDHVFTSEPDTMLTINSDTLGFKHVKFSVDYNGCISTVKKDSIFKVIGLTGDFDQIFTCDSSLRYKFKSKIHPVSSLNWYVDNVYSGNSDSLIYRFQNSGNYKVKLTAVDNSSHCNFSKEKLIKVRQVKAKFTLKDTIYCAGDSIKLN